MKLKALLPYVFLVISIGFSYCSGKDAATEHAEENGTGFEELTKFGSITLTLSGIQPNNIPFTNSETFKFAALKPGDNKLLIKDGFADFAMTRFLNTPDDAYQGSRVMIGLGIDNFKAAQTFSYFILILGDYAVISEDLTYFEMRKEFEDTDGEVSNFNFSNYSFNEQTNHLIFSFSFDVAAAANYTGNDLSVSGEVDVIVMEDVLPPD